MMNPGSLQDWPIENRNLFRLLGDKVRDTGIILTEAPDEADKVSF